MLRAMAAVFVLIPAILISGAILWIAAWPALVTFSVSGLLLLWIIRIEERRP